MWDRDSRLARIQRALGYRAALLRRLRARRGRAGPGASEPEFGRPAYSGLGVDLRLERERRRHSLTDVAVILRIQQHYLEAIEDGRFADLPGSAYATGFLRSYANFLVMNPETVIERFRQESTMAHGPTKLIFAASAAEPRRPRGTVVLLSFLAAGVLYAGWAYLNRSDDSTKGVVPKAPERLLAMLASNRGDSPRAVSDPSSLHVSSVPGFGTPTNGKETGTAGNAPSPGIGTGTADPAAEATAREAQRDADASMDDAALETVAREPSSRQRTSANATLSRSPSLELKMTAVPGLDNETVLAEDLPPIQPTMQTVEVPKPSSSMPSPPPGVREPDPARINKLPPLVPKTTAKKGRVPQQFGGNAEARVILRATVDSWVEIRGPQNELFLTRILRPGDTYYTPNRSDLVLTTGNIGGLEIFVDGKGLDSLGPLGAVRRNIPLDAEKLLAAAQKRRQRR